MAGRMKRIRTLRIFPVLVVAGAALMFSAAALSQASWRLDAVYGAPTTKKVVALTFDDGPDPRYTPRILSILKKEKAKATFFVVGKNVGRHGELLRRIARDGHEIGNHTWSHPIDLYLRTNQEFLREVTLCETAIMKAGVSGAELFRPPLGRTGRNSVELAEDRGYRTVLWTVSGSHREAKTPEAMTRRVLGRLRPGAIVLLHDGGRTPREKDVAATAMLVDELKARGYSFVTVSELLRMSGDETLGFRVERFLEYHPTLVSSRRVR